MKKSLFIAASLMVLTACTHETDIAVPAGEMTITARTETSAESRTVVEGETHVYWELGDEIAVFSGGKSGKFTTDITESSATATFKGTLGDDGWTDEMDIWAVYPYSLDAVFDGETITTTLPSEQVARFGSFGKDMNLAIAHSNSSTLQFYNVGGGIRFRLTQEGIKKVTFEGQDGEILSGKVKIGIGEDGIPMIKEVSDGSQIITLLPPSDNDSFPTNTWFYCVVTPCSLGNGYKLTFYREADYGRRVSEKAVSIKRSVFGNIDNADDGCEFVPITNPSTPETVDLGLSVKWASFNLGATKPEECGDYYAWGETEPYYCELNPLTWKDGKESGYLWPSYKWSMGDGNTMTKYCNDSSYGYNGFTDTKTVLDIEDDAAHVKLGGNWRMPTDAEWTELRENCTWTWTQENGVYGRKVISNKNGNSIFLPAAGYLNTDLYLVSSDGDYWSSSLGALGRGYAWSVNFDSGRVGSFNNERCVGFSVRPVYGGSSISIESVFLDKTVLELSVGDASTLVATILPENAADKSVTWSSSDESVASVSSTGVVTGVAIGSAVITVTTIDGGKTATCNVTVTKATVPIPKAVDLGLSVKWASFNLGAAKPEEYGDYYAWGEIVTKSYYDWSTYKWCMGDDNTLTKYCTNSSYGYNGFLDGKEVLDPADDAAHVNLRGNWRMPTDAEWTELRENCTWTWTTQNGVNGRLVTASNGNSIFLPAAGGMDGTSSWNPGSYGYYWYSSLNPDIPYCAPVNAFGSNIVGWDNALRFIGHSIRPVYTE